MRDYFNDFRKTNKETYKLISEKEYYHILRCIFLVIEEALLSGYDVSLGRVGILEVRKFKQKKTIEGSIIPLTNPDWEATRRAWREYPEMMEKRTILRYPPMEFKFKMYLNTMGRGSSRMFNLEYRPSRRIKRKLKEAIEDGSFDACLFRKISLINALYGKC